MTTPLCDIRTCVFAPVLAAVSTFPASVPCPQLKHRYPLNQEGTDCRIGSPYGGVHNRTEGGGAEHTA